MRIRSNSNSPSVALNRNHSYLGLPGVPCRRLSVAVPSATGMSVTGLALLVLAQPAVAGGLRRVADLADELLDHVFQEQHSLGQPVGADHAGQV